MIATGAYRHRRAGRWVILAIVAAGSAAVFAEPPRPWSPEVLAALETYRSGDFVAAQRLSVEVLSRSRDTGVRRDAAAIEALCLLRSPARADRVDGRTRLRQLAAEDATLIDEPECNLAYGIAQTELSETADALDALDRAAQGFAQQGLPARQAAALVALAGAWARHGEWEVTPPQFGVRRPQSVGEANEVRRAQIESLGPRIAALPEHEAALAELDLTLARCLLDAGDQAGDGLAILAQLAAAPKLTPVAAEAAQLLAQQHESSGQWAAALQLYQRLAQDWQGEIARQAGERAQEIARPQIVVQAPGWVATGQAVRVHVRVRGLEAVQVEVRQVDAEAWLSTARSRISEAFLPESGAVRLARDLSTRATTPYGWWDSEGLDSPLEFTGAPGAYVLIARGAEAGRPAQVVKRLIVVSDLRAACLVGPQHVVLWAIPPTGSADDQAPGKAGALHYFKAADELSAKFWMNRSFAPTEVKFEGQVARFDLPNEARVMRERGWVCLVRCGEHLAICRGSLPPTEPGQSTPQVALLAGPPAPSVGDTLYIAGLVLPPRGAAEVPTGALLELQVVDALEEVQFAPAVELSAGGAFAVQMPITAGLANKHLRVLARQGGRALENLLGRATASVPPLDTADFRVRVEVPPWLPAESALLTGRVRVEYPWGTAPARVRTRCIFRVAQLPTAADEVPAGFPGSGYEGRLDEDGQMAFALPLEDLGLSAAAERPLAVSVEARVQSWDGRKGVGQAEVLVGPRRPYAWLLCTPTQPQMGQDVRFQVGWFEPEGLAFDKPPEVVLRRGDLEVTRLRLQRGREGWTSAPWQPAEPGTYEAATSLDVLAKEPLVISQTVQVLPISDTAPAVTPTVRCRARLAAQGDPPRRTAVQVEVDGRSAGPLLVLAENGDPQAAGVIPALSDHAAVVLPLEAGVAARRGGLWVAVVRAGLAGPEWLGSTEVAPDPSQAIGLQVTVAAHDVWPGTEVLAQIACQSAAAEGGWSTGTTLTARLIDAADAGYVDFTPDSPSRSAERAASSLTTVWSAGGPAVQGGGNQEVAERSALAGNLRTALSEGTTLWGASLAAGGPSTEIRVPVPASSGLYKLIVVARTPAGETASDATILDARRGVRLEVNAPPRLTLGDRSVLAVLVENAYTEPIEAVVGWEVGAGLHLETVRIEGTGAPTTSTRPDEPVTIHVPAAGRLWLHLGVGAARAGSGRAGVELTARGSRNTASCPYEVQPADGPVAPETGLHIRRALVIWTPPSETDERESASRGDEARWSSSPFSSAAPLVPGQVLEVAEEFTLPEPTPELAWVQHVPPTCHTVMGDFPGVRPIGARQPHPAGALVFKVPALQPGLHVHRYFLSVVRPGVAVIPAPVLRGRDTTLLVAVEPADLQIVVAEVR
jgi:tetratricopeptide (TPR) repeat protein